MTHQDYMRLALELAKKGAGRVEPNPLVGAVIVRNNRIIGQGYHGYFGGPHAEINAINSVKNPEHIKGSTLYLTLEPCSHFGKMPPCADAIVYSDIKQVVIAVRDPNPLVSGRGVRLLKRNRINVIEGVLEKEARAINKPFFKAHEKGVPYVIAKWAMSMDARMSMPKARGRWITSEKARIYAKSLRARCQAVLVGIGTALKDDPGLLASVKNKNNPIRVVLDSKARLPLNSKLIKTLLQGPVWVMASVSAPQSRIAGLEKKGARVFRMPARQGRLDFRAVLRTLAQNGINKLMIEGGPEALKSAFDARSVDEVYCFIAPKLFGKRHALSADGFIGRAGRLLPEAITVKYLHPDTLVRGFIKQ
jgi:diaminohydroxyphosphoribosylaminopyrimidine deaminase/5-amino-6-(5-phosphoribosylamino)uracil reductase